MLLEVPPTMLYCSLEALSSTTSWRLRKLLPLPATMYKYLALTELAQEPCVVCDDVDERSASSKVNVRSEVCGDVGASDDDDALLIVAAFDRAALTQLSAARSINAVSFIGRGNVVMMCHTL